MRPNFVSSAQLHASPTPPTVGVSHKSIGHFTEPTILASSTSTSRRRKQIPTEVIHETDDRVEGASKSHGLGATDVSVPDSSPHLTRPPNPRETVSPSTSPMTTNQVSPAMSRLPNGSVSLLSSVSTQHSYAPNSQKTDSTMASLIIAGFNQPLRPQFSDSQTKHSGSHTLVTNRVSRKTHATAAPASMDDALGKPRYSISTISTSRSPASYRTPGYSQASSSLETVFSKAPSTPTSASHISSSSGNGTLTLTSGRRGAATSVVSTGDAGA